MLQAKDKSFRVITEYFLGCLVIIFLRCDMNKTLEHLCRVYLNKCQAFVRYRFLSQFFREKGYGCGARYFCDFAIMEYKRLLIVSDLINDINGESKAFEVNVIVKNPLGSDTVKQLDYEIERAEGNKSKYEVYAKVAFDEGYKDASRVMIMLAEAEYNHLAYLKDIRLSLSGEDVRLECDSCGYERKSKDKECPLCKNAYKY